MCVLSLFTIKHCADYFRFLYKNFFYGGRERQLAAQTHMKRKPMLIVGGVTPCLILFTSLSYNVCSRMYHVHTCSSHKHTHKHTVNMEVQCKYVCFCARVCGWEAWCVCVSNRSALLLSSPPLNLGASPLPAHQD